VQTSGLYRLTARIASLNGGGRFLLIADQQPVSGTISVPSTGGWQDWSTVQADSLFLPNGVHQLVMFILQGGFNLNRLTFDLIVAGVEEDKSESPLRYEIEQNFPNPFNPSTTFRYSIPKKGRVYLTIYNSLGQAVKTLVSALQPAGVYQVEWNARDFASGIYYYRLRSGDFSGTKRLILTE
jgi:hypothetical protein